MLARLMLIAVYKPDLPYVQQVRIVLAAHPRKMMTLTQVNHSCLPTRLPRREVGSLSL